MMSQRPREPAAIGGPWIVVTYVAVMSAAAWAAGCGPRPDDGRATQAAYEALAVGKSSLEAGRIAEARDVLEAATTKGGLQPDFYCEAVYLLGRCEALLGRFDKARAAVGILEQGDPDPDRVEGLRTVIREEEARRPAAPP